MNIKAFFVDALTAALDLKIGTPDDVLRHVTPDALAAHLPRPLWARLLTACLGAPRVDAQLVVETIGVANLCEHLPASILWGCIAEIGARSLGNTPEVAAPKGALTMTASGRAIIAPPPEVNPTAFAEGTDQNPVAIGPSIPSPAPSAAANQPLADLITELEQTDDPRPPLRSRTSTSTRFRQSNTGVGRNPLGAGGRRPQAMAAPVPVPPAPMSRAARRTGTEVSEQVAEPESPTNVQSAWGEKEIAVDDSQLVDWQTDVGAASAITGDEDFSDLGRKR